jgi:fructokinase
MILCLGEALVDLICERPSSSLAEVDSFTPHFGGALANVAVAAARAGGDAGLAGAAGDDEWGRWLRARLERESVDVRWFELLEGELTPLAFALVDEHGEASFQIYGDAIAVAIAAVEPRLEDAIDAADALVFSSTTLASERERRITLRARELARARGVRVLFDPNIRPNRWGGDERPAVEASAQLVAGSFCVRCNREEACAIAAIDEPSAAATKLAGMGAELAVVTLGADGAVIAGACEAEAPSPEVDVVSTLGAGDAFMGTLAAGLAALDWDPARAGEALPAALAVAAEACTRYSALD